MGEKKSAMSCRLKKAWANVTAFVRHCLPRRRPSRRLLSFRPDDRPVGLRSFLVDDTVVQNFQVRKVERGSSSSAYGTFEDDIDARAQIFIDNFRRQLRLERQISLQLRYYRSNSSETESGERSPPWSSIQIG